MEDFSIIPRSDYQRLMVGSKRLSSYDLRDDNLRVIGVKRTKPDNYEIFDWAYHSVLKKNGFVPNLANMIALHNFLLTIS